MRRSGSAVSLVALALVLAGCTSESTIRNRREVLRRDLDSVAIAVKGDVIEMKKAGIGDDVVINYLRATGSYFPMTRYDVVELADSGVSDSVINAMITGSKEEPMSATYVRGDRYWPYYYGWGLGYPYWQFWDPFYYGFRLGYRSPLYWSRPYWSGGHIGHGVAPAPRGGRSGGGRHR